MWGGVSLDKIIKMMTDGTIKIPEMAVLPTGIIPNNDVPPEVEVRFDFEKFCCLKKDENKTEKENGSGDIYDNENKLKINEENEVEMRNKHKFENHANWQLRFVHNQLFENLQNSNRFCPGAHHMTFVRKAAWKNDAAKQKYFRNCHSVQNCWKNNGPKLLVPKITDFPYGNGLPSGVVEEPLNDELTNPFGIYLFRDRSTIIEYFKPNFLPPYDTIDKIELIEKVLSKEWSEEKMCWVEYSEKFCNNTGF